MPSRNWRDGDRSRWATSTAFGSYGLIHGASTAAKQSTDTMARPNAAVRSRSSARRIRRFVTGGRRSPEGGAVGTEGMLVVMAISPSPGGYGAPADPDPCVDEAVGEVDQKVHQHHGRDDAARRRGPIRPGGRRDGRRLPHHLVPQPPYGQHVGGVGGIHLDLRPEAVDVGVDQLGVAHVLIAPHRLEERLS